MFCSNFCIFNILIMPNTLAHRNVESIYVNEEYTKKKCF